MNSKRIIDDLDFVELYRDINTIRDMNDEQKNKLRQLYTIYQTMYDVYCIYNTIDCNFNYLENIYIQSYNNNYIKMENNVNIDPILIHNYAYHVESLKLLQKLSHEKSFKPCVYIPTPSNNNLIIIGVCFSIVNLLVINSLIMLNIYSKSRLP
jgi:hypothetical protein